MCWTDDPVADFLRHDQAHEEWLETRPVCEHCEEPIQDECAVCIDDKWYCDECLSKLRKYIID